MRKKKVRTNYQGLRLDELHTLAGKVLDCIRDNETFTDLPMDIDTIEGVIQNFQQKWQTAKNGGSKWDKAIKDEARDAMLDIFSRLAVYVNQTANGNVPKLLSSGFYLESPHTPLSVPAAPILVELADGPQQSQLALRFKPVKSCWLYEYQYTNELDEESRPIWSEKLHVTRKTTSNIIAPTDSGSVYYARVRARNGNGVSDWSAVVSLMAR